MDAEAPEDCRNKRGVCNRDSGVGLGESMVSAREDALEILRSLTYDSGHDCVIL